MAVVFGKVTSCLHPDTQMGPATGFSRGVTYFIVAGYYISTTLAGKCMMAKGIKYSPMARTQRAN